MEEEYVMSTGLTFLRVTGFSPFHYGIFDRIRAFTVILTTACIYSLNILPLIIEYDGVQTLQAGIDSIPPGYQIMVNMMVAMVLRNKLKVLYEMVDQKWPDNIFGNELQRKISIYLRVFKRIFKIYRAMFILSSLVCTSKPLFAHSRILATQLYTPCDLLSNTCYITFLVVQNIYTLLLCTCTLFFDFIYVGFIFFAYIELEKIKYGFRNFDTKRGDVNDQDMYIEFCKIIKHHCFILRFIHILNDVYSIQLLSHFSMFLVGIVFSIVFMNKDGFPPSYDNMARYMIIFLANLFQLFIFCSTGEVIRNQLASVSDAVYESNWYTMKQLRIAKAMIIIIQISHVNEKIMIGKTWPLNFDTFMRVVKTSFSLQAFIQTAYSTGLIISDDETDNIVSNGAQYLVLGFDNISGP